MDALERLLAKQKRLQAQGQVAPKRAKSRRTPLGRSPVELRTLYSIPTVSYHALKR